MGYRKVESEAGFNGSYYINVDKEKLWIHDIEALSTKMGGVKEVVEAGYDVREHMKVRELSVEETQQLDRARKEMQNIFGDCPSDPYGRIYLGDGVYLDEDFDFID